MAIGGQDATIAFVDLWRGILLCDVRELQRQAACHAPGETISILSYVPVPSSIDKDREPRGDARLWRNIAVIQGRFKYVELKVHRKPSLIYDGRYTTTGDWAAAIFSRPAESSDDDSWRQDCYIDTTKSNDPRLNLLPNKKGRAAQPLKMFHIRQPVLGLQQGADILFFTAKPARLSENAWVVATDMRKKALHGVAAFSAARTVGIDFAYIESTASRYLKRDPSAGSLPSGSSDAEPDDEQG